MSMKSIFAVSALLMASAAHGQAPEGAPPPPPATAGRAPHEAAMRADLTLLLGLNERQGQALGAFLAAALPPPPPPGMGPRPGGPGGPGERGDMPPPPPPPESFLAALDGPAKHAEAERARAEAGRAFWATLDAGQRTKVDALVRLHALPLGPRPMGPPPMGRRPG